MNLDIASERFNLTNGQFYAYYRYKNLRWFLNDTYIGFGDLTDDQILSIAEKLVGDETFVGHNEHYGSEWQQTDLPTLIIEPNNIYFRADIVKMRVLLKGKN